MLVDYYHKCYIYLTEQVVNESDNAVKTASRKCSDIPIGTIRPATASATTTVAAAETAQEDDDDDSRIILPANAFLTASTVRGLRSFLDLFLLLDAIFSIQRDGLVVIAVVFSSF